MKKFLPIASVVLALASCTSNDIHDVVAQPDAIQISTYLAGQSRSVAKETTSALLQNEGFSLIAMNLADNSLYFQDYYKSDQDGSLSGNVVHNWPQSSLSFYALAGKNANLVSCDTAYNAYVNTQSAAVNDVIVACREKATMSQGVVNLQFNHILTQVSALLSCDASYCTASGQPGIYLSDITLTGTPSGTYSLASQAWVVRSDSTAFYTLFASETGVALTDTTRVVREGMGALETYGDEDCSLMLIPGVYTLTLQYQKELGGERNEVATQIDLTTMAGKKVCLKLNISDNRLMFADPAVSDWNQPGSSISVKQ